MKPLALTWLLATLAAAQDEPAGADAADAKLARDLASHQQGAEKLGDQQDELAADVQQLTIEQTHPKVIELFREVEFAMDDAAERLFDHQTDGVTIAAETDVIEKIYEAAKERQKQSSGSQGQPGSPGSAMLEMLGRMLGKEPGDQPGDQPGDKGGQGMEGDSDTANGGTGGAGDEEMTAERTVPKGSGTAGRSLPREFQEALDAYNRELEELER